MIGKGMGTGKVTYRGLLPPDDPIFKEGWTVSIVPQPRQRSAMPLDSALEEADNKHDDESQMDLRQNNIAEKPNTPQENLGPMTERMIADALRHHPTLTREEALEDLRTAGAC